MIRRNVKRLLDTVMRSRVIALSRLTRVHDAYRINVSHVMMREVM